MRAVPDRLFTAPELAVITGKSPDAVRQALHRLSGSGKGSGPVMKFKHGYYKYDPSKEEDSLHALVRSGNWKLENIRLVTKGAQGGVLSQSQEPDRATDPSDCDISGRGISRPGYPLTLPTGQKVTWEEYTNGTQEIRLSANGAPPFSPDHVLTLLQMFQKEGLDVDKWECKSIEVNVDSRKYRVDGCFTLQVIEGVLIKVYQHGYVARIEVADRRPGPLKEIMDLIQGLAMPIDVRITRKKVDDLEERVNRHDRLLSKRLPPGRKNSCLQEQFKREVKAKEDPFPGFNTAGELKAAQMRGGS